MSNKSLDTEQTEERVAALQRRAEDVEKIKSLLQEKIDAELIKMENNADRIGKRNLKCRRTPLKD